MENDFTDGPEREAAVLQTMLLFATLTTASEVATSMAERRAGRDPSEQQETSVARTYLRHTARELETTLMQLQTSLAYDSHSREGRIARLVRRFEQTMALNRIRRLLQGSHQRLLSLYPTVSEALAEEVRQLGKQAKTFVQGRHTDYVDDVVPFIARSLSFLVWMRREL